MSTALYVHRRPMAGHNLRATLRQILWQLLHQSQIWQLAAAYCQHYIGRASAARNCIICSTSDQVEINAMQDLLVHFLLCLLDSTLDTGLHAIYCYGCLQTSDKCWVTGTAQALPTTYSIGLVPYTCTTMGNTAGYM